MVASSGLIARDRTTMPNIYPIGWYLFDASARFLAILICPQRVIDISRMIVCTTQRFYLKIAGRCRSESHHYLPRWYVYKRGTISIPIVEWRGRLRSERTKKGFSSFFVKVIPAKNSSFQLAQNTVRSFEIQFGSTSIKYRAANDFGLFVGSSRRRGQFVCWERFRVFPKSFPSFVPGTSMKAESTYMLSNNQIDPLVECPFAYPFYLSSSLYLESFPSHYSTPGRTAKSHESRRNTTVKLKRSKAPWLSWWHCNKIATTCSLRPRIRVLTLNE